MMVLDPKGLEAAEEAMPMFSDDWSWADVVAAIRAYVSTITPAEAGGLVDVQTEAGAIALAAAGQVHDNADARCVETLVERLVATALTTAGRQALASKGGEDG